MKKLLIVALTLSMLLCAGLNAHASAPATPKMRLCIRTGPNTKYVELHSLGPSAKIRAIEYEKGNGVTWVMIQYRNNGKIHRAYTGLKRMTVEGDIPWASHMDEDVRIVADGQVYSAPKDEGGWRGHLDAGDWVTLLDYEDDYAFIEFSDNGTPSRGYVPDWMIDDEEDYDEDYDEYWDEEDYDYDDYDDEYWDEDEDWDEDDDYYEGYGYLDTSYFSGIR